MNLVEALKVGIPSLILLAGIFGAYYNLDKSIDTHAERFQGQLNLLKQVQDATRIEMTRHRTLPMHPGASVEIHKQDKRQEVLETVVTDMRDDVKETKELVQELIRRQNQGR